MRRDVQLFLGKEKFNPPSTGDNIVSNSTIDTDSDYNLTNHTIISGGKCEMTTLSGSEASMSQSLSGLQPNSRYQMRLEGIEYPNEELVINRAIATEDLNSSSWAKSGCVITSNNTTAPDGTNTADRIFAYSTNYVQDVFDWFAGEPIYLSVYVKKETSSTVSLLANKDKVSFNIDTQTFGTAHNWSDLQYSFAGNGWYRISGKYTPTADESKPMGISNIASGSSIWAWGFQVQREGSLGTYVKNDNTSQGSYGYVNHTTQTVSNFVDYSREINNSAWTKSRLNATDNEVNDFFGVNKGTRVSGTVSLQTAYAYQRIVIDEDLTDYVLTFYIKADSANYAALRVSDDKNTGSRDFFYATMDFSDGSLSSQSDSINVRFSTFEYQHSGWYKVSIGIDASNTSQFEFLFSPRFDLGHPFQAPTTSGLPSMYISNIQLEKASVKGQYVGTTGTSNVELSKIGNTVVVSDTLDNSGGLQYIQSLENGTTSRVIDFITGENTGDLRIRLQGTSPTATLKIDSVYINQKIDSFYSTEQYSVDMFDFEDINVVDKIKDVRDISKVFTEYTQKFTVPASANNNELFDHFYNENVVSGFDHRLKHEAVIKIGGADYKHGQLTLLSSSMKNGQPYSYSVVFYGNTVKLKDLIGDDKLSELTGTVLDNLNIEYNSTNIFDLMTYGMNFDSTDTLVVNTANGEDDPTPDVFVPFISCDSHYFYDSVDQPQVKDRVSSRNVKFGSGQETKGIYYKDLKLAIKVKFIIRAIEEKYGLKFSKDFFNENIEAYNELSLFLHKERGGISKQLETTSDSFTLKDLVQNNEATDWRGVARFGANSEGWDNGYLDMYAASNLFGGGQPRWNGYRITYDITPVGTGEYTVEMTDLSPQSEGNSDFTWTGTGNFSANHIFKHGTDNGESFNYDWEYVIPKFSIKTQSGITGYSISNFTITRVSTDLYQLEENPINSSNWLEVTVEEPSYDYDNGDLQSVGDGVSIQSQVPNMKVLDFLTSIFKMFNLTAYFVPKTAISPFAGQIRVRTLDSYYISGKQVDISPYVDTAKSSISRNKLFSTVEYEYEDHKTIASIKQSDRTGDIFGSEYMNNINSSLENPLAFDGGKYNVKAKFEKVMYERMNDQSDETTILPIQWGWMASKDENPVLGKALLFYPIYQDVSGYYDEQSNEVQLDFDTSIYNKNKELVTSSHSAFSNYIRPSNSLKGNSNSLHFGSEYDEWYVWEGTGSNENSLFNNYHRNYLTSIYDIQSRLVTVETNLPVNILMKLKLEDVVIINKKLFRINSLDLNITTGKSKMELMNDIAYSKLIIDPVRIFSRSRSYIPTQSDTVTNISIDDSSANDNTHYKIYSNGVFIKDMYGFVSVVYDAELTSGLNVITVRKIIPYDEYTSKESPDSNTIEITV